MQKRNHHTRAGPPRCSDYWRRVEPLLRNTRILLQQFTPHEINRVKTAAQVIANEQTTRKSLAYRVLLADIRALPNGEWLCVLFAIAIGAQAAQLSKHERGKLIRKFGELSQDLEVRTPLANLADLYGLRSPHLEKHGPRIIKRRQHRYRISFRVRIVQ